MKISFGSGHDHASLVSSPTLNATGDAPCPSLRSGERTACSGMSCAMKLSALGQFAASQLRTGPELLRPKIAFAAKDREGAEAFAAKASLGTKLSASVLDNR